MRSTALRTILVAAYLTGTAAHAQECLLYADFEDGLPAGWDIGAQVERLDAEGAGTGEFVDAWRVGNAADANTNGYFPVPSQPPGNHFVMANDDAPPCDCDMADVTLTTPSVDLGSAQYSAVSFRAFHNGAFGSGDAVLETSMDGGQTWNTAFTIPAVPNVWQEHTVDLGMLDGQFDVRLRFRWSDGGNWSSGVAFDDICIHGRVENDLQLVSMTIADARNGIFDTDSRALEYALLPVEQAAPVVVSATVRNRGRLASFQVMAEVTLVFEGSTIGTFSSAPVPVLGPGSSATVVMETGWMPDATGELIAEVLVMAAAADQYPEDNSGEASMRFTGPGFEDGNNVMAQTYGLPTGSLPVSDTACSPSQLFELLPGSTVHGMSVLLDPDSDPGSTVRATLLTSEFNEFALSDDLIISEADLTAAANGEALYLALQEPVELTTFSKVLATLEVRTMEGMFAVRTSGHATAGAAYCLASQVVAQEEQRPLIRVHLAQPVLSVPATGLPGVSTLHCHPNPFTDQVWVAWTGIFQGGMWLEVYDLLGTLVHRERAHMSGSHVMDLGHLAPGSYVLSLVANGSRSTSRLLKTGTLR